MGREGIGEGKGKWWEGEENKEEGKRSWERRRKRVNDDERCHEVQLQVVQNVTVGTVK